MEDDDVVEEIVIIEDDGDDGEGEWELGEDGYWYCVVDEYYEEDIVSPSGNKTTNISKHNPRIQIVEPSASETTNSIKKLQENFNPKTPEPQKIFSARKSTQNQINSPLLGIGRASSTMQMIDKPKMRTKTTTITTTTTNQSPKKQIPQRPKKKKVPRSPNPIKPTPLANSNELPVPKFSSRYGGASALEMTQMKSSPSTVILASKNELENNINNSPTRASPTLYSKQRSSYRSVRDPLNRSQSSDTVAGKKLKPKKTLTDEKPIGIFGQPLNDVILLQKQKTTDSDENTDIPFIVSWTVEYIRENGMKTNGIFRLSGHHGKQLEKQQLIDSGASKTELNLVRKYVKRCFFFIFLILFFFLFFLTL